LVSGQDEVVLCSVRIKPKVNYDNSGSVPVWKVLVISIVKVHVRPDRILKPPASAYCLQHVFSVPLHFGVLFADMTPAFIGQINVMAQLIFDTLRHGATSVTLDHHFMPRCLSMI
jgi:hypothetical protein